MGKDITVVFCPFNYTENTLTTLIRAQRNCPIILQNQAIYQFTEKLRDNTYYPQHL